MLIERLKNCPADEKIFNSIRQLPYSFWLDSARDYQGQGRYSFMGCDPFLVLKAKGSLIELTDSKERKTFRADPFQVLQHLLKQYRLPKEHSWLPFGGGAVGYFSYDLGRQLEKLPEKAREDLQIPDLYLCFYDIIIMLDNLQQEIFLISTGLPAKEHRAMRAKDRMQTMKSLVAKTAASAAVRPKANQPIFSHFNETTYCQAVSKAIDYIAAGDIFVVNLSQRLATELTVPPYELYSRLRRINPAPFASFLEYPGLAVASASPERFLKITDGMVQTRPIKGTRPRGNNELEDDELRRELWNSTKDRAELTMIVDLERNDLGKVCRFGSVNVPELFRLEEYATVFHLVATVEGMLRQDKDAVDLLRAAFPGGSITGAPKIRAMEIIDELEPVRRGLYTGSIGYLDFNGDADLNIVIRTFLLQQNKAYFGVGGGITLDSDPLFEYRETWDKAKALINALQLSEKNEINLRSCLK